MKIISWNTNGLRATVKQGYFMSLFSFNNPDIVLEALDDLCGEQNAKKNDGLLQFYSAHSGCCDHLEKLTNTQKKLIHRIPNLLKNHKNMFSSVQVSSQPYGINLEAINECSSIIKELLGYNIEILQSTDPSHRDLSEAKHGIFKSISLLAAFKSRISFFNSCSEKPLTTKSLMLTK